MTSFHYSVLHGVRLFRWIGSVKVRTAFVRSLLSPYSISEPVRLGYLCFSCVRLYACPMTIFVLKYFT